MKTIALKTLYLQPCLLSLQLKPPLKPRLECSSLAPSACS